jgi:quinol monooxygenase YgiN
MFPPAFAGFALAAIAIGALVPASIMAIAAANLFSRNIYRKLVVHPSQPEVETRVSKLASLTVKFAAVGFILVAPTTYVVNFQLAGGVWIVQTLPAVFLSLFLPWLDRKATIAGWTVGTAIGSWLLVDSGFASSTVHLRFLVLDTTVYVGLAALVANLLVVLGGSAVAAARRRARARARAGDAAQASEAGHREVVEGTLNRPSVTEKLTVVVRLRAKPGEEQRVEEELSALLAPTRAEAGCINFDLHRSDEDPALFLVHENWESEAHLNDHFRTPHVEAWLAVAESVLAEPMELTRWHEIA